MQADKKTFDSKKLCFALAFCVPAIVILLNLVLRSCAPFGKNSFCTMDGFSQYYPMLENMQRALRDKSLFYSFSGGLGFNLWSQSAYYTNSPLWLLLYLMPQSTHTAVINLTVMLRFCLSGLFFCIYLNARKPVTSQRILPYTALSTAYAFCGWSVAFMNQFMWMDCMMLLPLVILGIEKIYSGKSPVLYTVTLFLCIWSCFYIAYMVCIFAVLWQLKLIAEEKKPLRDVVKSTAKFAGYSVIAAGITAVSLLPLLHTISLTKASGLGLDEARQYGTILNLIINMLPFTGKSLEYGAPNIYCTVCAVIMAAVMAFSKKIPLRKRITGIVLWLILILSFEISVLYYVWHGFHFPNQLPGRFSFVYVFFILVCASGYIEYYTFAPSGQGLRTLGMKKTAFAMFVLMLIGGCINFVPRITSNPDSLFKFSDIGAVLSAYSEKDGTFSRQELSPLKSNNQGLQYGFNGIGWYSSTMSAAHYDFFQQLGLPKYAKNVSTYYSGSKILNAVFSIKYLADPETGEIKENPCCLPLAFLADSRIKDFDIMQDNPPKVIQKDLWQSLCGEDIGVKTGSARLSENGLNITSMRADRITGTISCPEDGVFFTTVPDDGGWTLYIDSEKADTFLSAGLLLSCDITQGEHTVEMKYVPPLLIPGAFISLLSAAAFLLLMFYGKYRKKGKNVLT